MGVGIVACSAAYRPFLKALRALERLNYESCLTEPAIFVKTFAGELDERLANAGSEEIARAGIVQFTGWAGLPYGGLHVALGTDGDELAVVDRVEVYRRS